MTKATADNVTTYLNCSILIYDAQSYAFRSHVQDPLHFSGGGHDFFAQYVKLLDFPRSVYGQRTLINRNAQQLLIWGSLATVFRRFRVIDAGGDVGLLLKLTGCARPHSRRSPRRPMLGPILRVRQVRSEGGLPI